MADEALKKEAKSSYTVPSNFMFEGFEKAEKPVKVSPPRALQFDNDKQRNARNLSKGLAKPGYISNDTLRRASRSVHVASICKTTLKEKVTKTRWQVGPKDPAVDANTLKTQIDTVSNLLKKPNPTDTWRSFLDKSLEDLLVLDCVFWEKTRFPTGELAQLYHVDSAVIHPVFNEYGETNIEIPLETSEGEKVLPVAYLQVMNYSQYGGPESGDITAAWPQEDAIRFHMHPQGSMEMFGFGMSPLEMVLSVVLGILNADNFNATYFEEGGFPPIILQLVGQMTERDLERYREYMLQELTGHFQRPAIIAGEKKMEAINLKDLTNRDMQFMEYMLFEAKLMCAAYGMMPQDIGLTDAVGGKNVSETQKDLSEGKGYTSILRLIEEQINLMIEEEFGFEDIQFEFVADDTMSETEISTVVDQRLKNGSMTLNESRKKFGDVPFGPWANDPVILNNGQYQMLGAEQIQDPVEIREEQQEMQEKSLDAKSGGEDKKPFGKSDKDAANVDDENFQDGAATKTRKSIYTKNYRVFMDDRGYSQPFIYVDLLTGRGRVIKPPVAVNLMSQQMEVQISKDISGEGINVPLVKKATYTDVLDSMPEEVRPQFLKYVSVSPEYDSEKWKAKVGSTRKFPYYLTQDFIDGYNLKDKRLIEDMQRDPDSYVDAVKDLAAIWLVEKKMKLGDRRADQYIVSTDKQGWGFDYQFKNDDERWTRTKDALPDALKQIPELWDIFKKETGVRKRIWDAIANKKS